MRKSQYLHVVLLAVVDCLHKNSSQTEINSFSAKNHEFPSSQPFCAEVPELNECWSALRWHQIRMLLAAG